MAMIENTIVEIDFIEERALIKLDLRGRKSSIPFPDNLMTLFNFFPFCFPLRLPSVFTLTTFYHFSTNKGRGLACDLF